MFLITLFRSQHSFSDSLCLFADTNGINKKVFFQYSDGQFLNCYLIYTLFRFNEKINGVKEIVKVI